MKKVINFIPLYNRKNRIIFIKNFINDFMDALIGFFVGAAIEAIFNFEIIKAIVFIILYIIFAIVFRSGFQKLNNQDKDNLKFYWGIKEIKKENSKNILERGIFIFSIILFAKVNLSLLFLIIQCIWRLFNVTYILKNNLIYSKT